MEDGSYCAIVLEETKDGLAGEEGTFLVCSFWLADAYTMIGRGHDAEVLFERLLSLRNDLGLLAEEYHPRLRRQLGNFPQAFSHIGLINTAYNFRRVNGPAQQRADPARRLARTAPPGPELPVHQAESLRWTEPVVKRCGEEFPVARDAFWLVGRARGNRHNRRQ